jgi:hypothetical protein
MPKKLLHPLTIAALKSNKLSSAKRDGSWPGLRVPLVIHGTLMINYGVLRGTKDPLLLTRKHMGRWDNPIEPLKGYELL